MRKIFTGIVRHPKQIIIIFAILALICSGCKKMVGVNYDMTDYLPEDSPSTVAMNTMEEEFSDGIPGARVMVQNVSVAEALEYKEQLEAIEGVTNVTWLDDAASIYTPLEYMDQEEVETYYKDGAALFSVTIEDGKNIETVAAIRELIGEENAMDGTAVSDADSATGTVDEVAKIGMLGTLFVLCVLLLTTTSWLEPFIILIGMGVAIVLNEGSNLIFGEISFVSNAAGSVLQMAVSLDYSVFLLHRYQDYHKEQGNVRTAMTDALCDSISSILSSGLTTVIGFLALCMMSFRIGPDLGLVLAKGIALSLITVFVFLPAMIVLLAKWIEKTKHRSFMPSFHKFGKVIRKVTIPCVCLFVMAIVPSYLASNANSYYYGASEMFGEGTRLGDDTRKIQEIFGQSDSYVLLVPKDDVAKQKELSEALQELPEVTSIISYVDLVGKEIPQQYLDSSQLSKLYSDHYARIVLSVDVDFEGEETFALVERIREIAEEYYPGQWQLAGQGVSTLDLKDTITADTVKVNFLAIAAVVVVLLIVTKSISIPVILVLGIETAIWINMSLPYFMGNTIFYIAYLIISSIQLGATVDYAILFTDTYMEKRENLGKKEAVAATVEAVTVSILTSGSVMTVVGFLMGKVSTSGLLSQMGYFLGKGTIFSLLIVFFVLPGLLYLLDSVIQKTTKGIKFRQEKIKEKKRK